jgi:RNA polymerase sigma factor (sigma-70 family)
MYSAFSSLEDGVLFSQLVHALQDKLTADQRNVIILRFMEEFSLRETASIMGKTVQNVKVLQLRALAALHRALEHRGIRKAMSFDKGRYMPGAWE